VHWTDPTDVEIVVLGPDGDPQAQLMRLFQGEGDRLALVHSSHEPVFVRLQRWFGRATRTLDTASGVSLVLVLTDDDAVRSIAVQATTTIDTAARLANVIGTVPGRRPDELLIFSGHYDHVGIRTPVDGDSIANGANDNASGTTAVIELARYYHALGQPERTLVFVAFAAEEAGGYGSAYLAGRLSADEIVALLNIEMIGKLAAEGPHRAWLTGWDESDVGPLLAAAVPDSVFAFAADPYPDENLFYRSDNAVFARLGVPAHSISTTPIDVDPDYHRVTDEVETLDLDHVTATIRAIALAARPIVAGTVTPSRIDPDRLQ
jgi:Zn-dependent M28 family amino/carboxypeptidase